MGVCQHFRPSCRVRMDIRQVEGLYIQSRPQREQKSGQNDAQNTGGSFHTVYYRAKMNANERINWLIIALYVCVFLFCVCV
jgi:hypothetical protein